MLQNRGAGREHDVHIRATFGELLHCKRGPLYESGRLARAFLAKFCMVVAGVE